MGENIYWSSGNLYINSGNSNWGLDTAYTVTSLDSKIEQLEKDNKELRKRLSNLATLVCTHIGKEQMEKFYKENE